MFGGVEFVRVSMRGREVVMAVVVMGSRHDVLCY